MINIAPLITHDLDRENQKKKKIFLLQKAEHLTRETQKKIKYLLKKIPKLDIKRRDIMERTLKKDRLMINEIIPQNVDIRLEIVIAITTLIITIKTIIINIAI